MVDPNTPEFATTTGSWDDTAFDEGSAVTTHMARQQARNANQWLKKHEAVPSIVFHGTPSNTERHSRIMHGRVSRWVRIIPAFIQPKKPVHRYMSVVILGQANYKCYVGVNTRGSDSQYGPTRTATITPSTPGAFSDFAASIDNIRVVDEPFEELEFFAKGESTYVARTAFVGTGGTFSSGYQQVLSAAGGNITLGGFPEFLTDDDWGTGTSVSLPTEVQFLTGTSTTSTRTVGARYDVVGVPTEKHMQLSPPPNLPVGNANVYAHFFALATIKIRSINMVFHYE